MWVVSEAIVPLAGHLPRGRSCRTKAGMEGVRRKRLKPAWGSLLGGAQGWEGHRGRAGNGAAGRRWADGGHGKEGLRTGNRCGRDRNGGGMRSGMLDPVEGMRGLCNGGRQAVGRRSGSRQAAAAAAENEGMNLGQRM